MKNKNIPQIVKGHEIWLEPEKDQCHPGEEVRVKVLWGHNMKRDGLADKTGLKAYLVDQQGERKNLEVQEGDETSYLITFRLERDGLYTVILESDFGIYTVTKDGKYHKAPKCEYPDAERASRYEQFAKTVIAVGDVAETRLQEIGTSLEIVSLSYGKCRLGDEVEFLCLFAGKPASKAVFKATYDGMSGKPYKVLETNSEGKVAVTLDNTGNWMFLVNYTDLTDRVEGKYDERCLAATFTLMNVR